MQRVRWWNVVEVLVLWFAGTLAGTAGNEQDVTGLQRHVRSFPRQNLLKVYRNLSGAVFAFPDEALRRLAVGFVPSAIASTFSTVVVPVSPIPTPMGLCTSPTT